MTIQTKFFFQAPTLDNDQVTPITDVVTYTIVVTPSLPVGALATSYTVPAANVTAAVAGLVTVKFTDIAFVPHGGVSYSADVYATDATGKSGISVVLSFTYDLAPNPPTGFGVG